AEDGQVVTLVITDSASGSRSLSPSVTGNVWSATVDLSGLADGTLSMTADVSDVAGNPATQATSSLAMDQVAPTGHGV
ncbi:MAG: Ig-like domain-containing protein, partial [Pelagimonas sp.]|uniref:Ig-like domain-containing protein n=1 Tax=Pelagimonas sp. TaxID=2073170 RepID=UPI003D6B1ED4